MKILVIGSPKRDFHVGFDALVLGLARLGADFDHYPNILTQSYGHTGTYQLSFDTARISYPDFRTVEENLGRGRYGLVITMVSRVDYRGGRHGYLSYLSRRLKFSLPSNRPRMGGSIVSEWIRKGVKLPPFIVVDDLDDPFIHPVDYALLKRCAVYFKRELPFNRFQAFRLFRFHLENEELMALASKLRPVWISYDRPSIEAFADLDSVPPYCEREIDITFLGSTHASYSRQMLIKALDGLKKRYRVITPEGGRKTKGEFYDALKRSRIVISMDGRGWDATKHYELPLFGGLLFIARPTVETAIGLKDGHNCVFIDNHAKDLEGLAGRYLSNPSLSAEIAQRGMDFARNELGNARLAEYVLKTAGEALKGDAP